MHRVGRDEGPELEGRSGIRDVDRPEPVSVGDVSEPVHDRDAPVAWGRVDGIEKSPARPGEGPELDRCGRVGNIDHPEDGRFANDIGEPVDDLDVPCPARRRVEGSELDWSGRLGDVDYRQEGAIADDVGDPVDDLDVHGFGGRVEGP